MNKQQRREWRAEVLGHSELTPAQKLVLLGLETFADYPEGTNARPGVAVLADRCRLKARAVEAALAQGRRLGLIEQTARANPKAGLAAVYRLLSTRTSVRIEADSTRTSVRIEADSTRTTVRIEDGFNPHETVFQPARDDISTRTLMQPTNPITPRENTKGGHDAPRCARHRDHPNPPPCHDCKQAREQIAAEDATWHHDTREAIDRCRDCDQFGRRDDLTDCPHHDNFRSAKRVPA
ncbi:helix-turn-helix domain-containing protein [Mycolicibacterium sp. PAM1]|uniref:Helix-turn-helix DNA binding domain protein n=1 Tax=Mycolicibacterium gilvum (strain PYR-GCK) TaxID=350054 RepID=A4TBL8_MYCGI|nr:hypothetical protein [Mycolicibacterium sp. PAM1]ABP45400.1 hypothetical protein Mflv_2923 [Mycolicibacterium gilvum PYR-GCK]MBV5244334.1 helix-turn-helix domain-containing protein [Mycolicibacterium sp. PAM1]